MAMIASSSLRYDRASVRLRLIGQMSARMVSGENILPPGRKTRGLFAYLAMTSPRAVLRGRLAELLWSRRPEEQARASLRQEIHRLMDCLSGGGAGILDISRDHLALRLEGVWVDVHDIREASAEQSGCLALLDGELLEGLDGIDPNFDTWLTTERERLRDHGRGIAEALLKQKLEPEAAIEMAQRLLSFDRSHEGAWRALIRAHVARGERGLAMQAYDRCRAALADLLDAVPSAETQHLLNEIRGPRRQRLPLQWSDMTAPAAPWTPHSGGSATDPDGADGAGVRDAGQLLAGDASLLKTGARVGILPFRPMGFSDDERDLATGLADEIASTLLRFRWMFVVPSAALGQMAAERPAETPLSQAFGLDFLLDGSVQRAGRRFRVRLQLLDPHDHSRIVWARRFDRETDDILGFQDEVAAEVAAQLDPEIMLIEARRGGVPVVMNASAYGFVARAVPLIGRMEYESYLWAGHYLEQAVARDQQYAPAHAWYALWHVFLVDQGWADDPTKIAERAGELAERAIRYDPSDARGYAVGGYVRAHLQRRPREAMTLHDRALALNPNLAMAWAMSGATCAYIGDLDEAIRRLLRYRSLSPVDPYAFVFDGILGLVHLSKHAYEDAVACCRAAALLNPAFVPTYAPYLAALGCLGWHEEATRVRERLLAQQPAATVEGLMQASPLQPEALRLHFAAGLRLAGVPEATAGSAGD